MAQVGSRGDSVDMENRLGAGQLRNRGLVLGRGQKASNRAWSPQTHFLKDTGGANSQGIKRPWREAENCLIVASKWIVLSPQTHFLKDTVGGGQFTRDKAAMARSWQLSYCGVEVNKDWRCNSTAPCRQRYTHLHNTVALCAGLQNSVGPEPDNPATPFMWL
jgi:hypothetical protein